MGRAGHISLRGVAVHNLKQIDLDLPRRKLIVVCGLSGSGKSSLALDTLYAEGQRRFIETFSAYTRQFLEQCEKPEAESIEGIPPAIAVARRSAARSSRSTVGTATETADYLRLLYAKIGRVVCHSCGRAVRADSPQSTAESLAQLPEGTRFMVAFGLPLVEEKHPAERMAALVEDGFVRVVTQGRTYDLREGVEDVPGGGEALVVVDRLTAGRTAESRLRDSVELAFEKGQGRCYALVPEDELPGSSNGNGDSAGGDGRPGRRLEIDGRAWRRLAWSRRLRCEDCDLEYPEPEPRLFSFNSPLGACPRCEGFGNVIDVDMDLVVPEPERTLREGAIAPWRTPAYEHELRELMDLAGDYGVPLDVPWRELGEETKRLVWEGVPEREFGGLRGFFRWLERRKYKTHIRAFLSRWRSYHRCPECEGRRLRPEALATRVGGLNMADVSNLKISDAARFFAELELSDWDRTVARMMLEQVQARLGYLEAVGLGYLTLDRALRTLSGGEAQRVALTSALGSSLVNMLYVLDEPSIGLHPRDTDRLLSAMKALRDRGNTVVVVEHEESVIRAADQVVEIGPGAGERGGRVTAQGTPEEIAADEDSITGAYLAGRRRIRPPEKRRETNRGWIRLRGARGHNLQNLEAQFPLGVLCLVTGVSGSGKSTLVQDTLYPALCQRLRKDGPKALPFDEVLGGGQIDDVVLVDQTPIGRSPRSNPVTYIKAFDAIRSVFADTIEARTRNYAAGHFSFNSPDGRCNACNGEGYKQIDMQFLADVSMKCSECQGSRYRSEILEVTYRGRNIAEVLEMTAREAFTFFRGQRNVQKRLKRLLDVGLDYLRLGQPANTLSGGESQRLKLASYMASGRGRRVLFILDEPTTGLHFADIVPLLDCFDALVDTGHSLVVIEHNLHLIKVADYLVDLGPGAADEGGQIVAEGTPEEVAANKASITGRFLATALRRAREEAEEEQAV